MKKYKITLNRKDCIGCGTCHTICPQLFSPDEEDGRVHLKNSHQVGDIWAGEITDQDLDTALQAEEACPVNVIHIQK